MDDTGIFKKTLNEGRNVFHRSAKDDIMIREFNSVLQELTAEEKRELLRMWKERKGH